MIKNVKRVGTIQELNEEQEEGYLEEEGENQHQETDIDPPEKQRERPVKREKIRQRAMESNSPEDNIRAFYERICWICLKPKCSIICRGTCNRVFHRLCFEGYRSGSEEILEAINLNEIGMRFDEWAAQIDQG